MAFRGWPDEAVEFYEGLLADNSKNYWHQHKSVYDEAVHRPMVELLAELEPEFGEGRLFRPYRDVRFSADKSPYKPWIGATLATGGYVQFSADGVGAGRGMFMLASDQLDRYRSAVVDDASGADLSGIVGALRADRIEITAHDVLKTAPRGYPRDHPRAELLRHKGLIAWREWPVGRWVGTRSAKTRIVDFLRAAAPLSDWLDRHVGPSTTPDRR